MITNNNRIKFNRSNKPTLDNTSVIKEKVKNISKIIKELKKIK